MERGTGTPPIIVPLRVLDRRALALAGGKAANLGELLQAGFAVPPGFCLTTAAYARAAADAGLGPLLDRLAGVPATAVDDLAALAAELRACLVAGPVTEDVGQAVREALADLGGMNQPVAVRSSATAEDLPFASFAGQQDTYLNIVGADAVLDAVRRCWASLWTDRAVIYRARNGIDPGTVQLAVVIQRLIDAAVAGVLFTANPVTGRRGQAVIDASPGLGEAVVSGAVNPDHFVIDTRTGEVLERRLGDKRVVIKPAAGGGTRLDEASASGPCLADGQLQALARLGQRVEAHFGAPQDLELAVDRDGVFWLTQARPITTLFPLPPALPDAGVRVYFNINVAQGMFRPFTPMGVQAVRLVTGSIAALIGAPPADPIAGPRFLVEAAGRLFGDVTGIVRLGGGRRVAAALLPHMEARSEPLLQALFADPRLAPRPLPWPRLPAGVVRLLQTTRLPPRLLAAFLAPTATRLALVRVRDELIAAGRMPPGISAAEQLDQAERLLLTWPPKILPRALAPMVTGLGAFAVAAWLLGDLASPEERDTMRRALPHNPTTEMNLALWALAKRIGLDHEAVALLRKQPSAELGRAYKAGALPPVVQEGLQDFLARYGHRAAAEIDLGIPRWSEDPTPLFGTLVNYLALADSALAPDAQFRAMAAQAEATVALLVNRAAQKNWWRGRAVALLLGRGRALAGLRELPKFLLVLLFAQARARVVAVGEELARRGRLAQADDVFFLTLPEVRLALHPEGADLRAWVRERQGRYAAELRRRHLPRLLLSDGTEPGHGWEGAEIRDGQVLRGTPASAGRTAGRARLVLDPAGARLEPGDILVAPSTDPGWTPLFLTAGALVVEMGGAMSHGAVVAREYGIPAVVGVPQATERIIDGQELVVDGTAGTVVLGLVVNGPRAAPARPRPRRQQEEHPS
jgi:phosphohistidine swiveling domain-containing protein